MPHHGKVKIFSGSGRFDVASRAEVAVDRQKIAMIQMKMAH
jgi:hypothetical protein